MKRKHKSVSATVKNDPSLELAVGSTIQFKRKFAFPNDITGIKKVDNWEFSDGMILSMTFTNSDLHNTEGSAALVAPGIAICASHVLHDYLDKLKSGDLACYCFGIYSNGLIIWKLKQLTMVSDSDLTILSLELASDMPKNNVLHQAVITTRTPVIGEKLLLCGFKPNNKEHKKENIMQDGWSESLFASQGVVTAAYPSGRDTAFIKWPCLEVDSLSYGGMSGGPVFDSRGHLVGLICSSIKLENEKGISYISLIWPGLTTEFQGFWPKGIYKQKTSLIELLELCFIDKRDAIKVDKGIGKYNTEYKIWN